MYHAKTSQPVGIDQIQVIITKITEQSSINWHIYHGRKYTTTNKT